MRRFISLLILALLAVALVGAQNLQDNEDFRKARDYRAQSRQALDEGDYERARELAELAQFHAEQSDAYVSMMLARFRANSALTRLKLRLEDASYHKTDWPEEYAEGTRLYNLAYELYRQTEYEESRTNALKGLEVLEPVQFVRREGTLPAAYVVRLLPGNTDCLWNIAGYDFVYGNPWLWRRLYEANRDRFPQPDNPDLILPGMVLAIPPREGESRRGTWRDGEIFFEE